MISYRLNKKLDLKSVAKNIVNQIKEYEKDNDMNDAILTIEIRNISHTINGLTGRLENNLEESNDEKNNLPKQS